MPEHQLYRTGGDGGIVDLAETIQYLSLGVGLLDSSNFQLIAANQRLLRWFNMPTLPRNLTSFFPQMKPGRLVNVVKKIAAIASRQPLMIKGWSAALMF